MAVKHKKLIIALSVVGGVIVAVIVAFFIYVGIYYHATDNAKLVASTDTEYYTVCTDGDGNTVFKPTEPSTVGLIFYPGGKVEHTAYAPLMAEFARRGVLCVLVDMPFRLAVFDVNAADGLRENFPEVTRWYIGGHSLGGSMAASYLEDHVSEYEGLLLLGSYSTVDFSSTELNVISVYGSEDGVLNSEKYAENISNLPQGYGELVIEGGCHAWFGDYGAQDGDGSPTITAAEQWKITADFFIESIAA